MIRGNATPPERKLRYGWEPWHYGYTLNAGTSSVGFGARASDGERSSSLPSFVPARFAAPIARAARRWNVSAALLSAQLYAESNFNPFARSPSEARAPKPTDEVPALRV